MADFSGGTGTPAREQKVGNFFEAIRTMKSVEDELARPLGKGDPVLTARLRELRGYVDVFLKAEAPRRPRFVVTTARSEAGAPQGVEASFADGVQFYEALNLSLSKGGLFIKTESLLPIDALLDMDCRLEAEGVSFKVAAKVIWLNPREAQGRPAGMGLKLYRLSTVQRQVLTDFMNGDLPPEALEHLSE